MDASLLEDLRRCGDDPGADEGRIAALVARLLDPGLDPGRIEADLDDLSAGCPTTVPPWRYLAEAGFAGNAGDYGSLDNSNLARVLHTRRGIPITLGVVLIRVARGSGRTAHGINFPGHFLVAVGDTLVDPFVMQVADPEPLVERLPAARRNLPAESLFAAAGPVAVGLRMLNNIKMAYSRQAVWHKALDVLDAQLALAPDHAGLTREKAEVWRRLGGADDVVH